MSAKLRNKKGFTLIELVIVLAIAALILAGVLLAVSGAQRSQRDNDRKNVVSRVASQLEQYASNNSGAYPTTAPQQSTFTGSYATNLQGYSIGWTGSPTINQMVVTYPTARQYQICITTESGSANYCQSNN